MQDANVLECAGLRKRYGDLLAVDGVSFGVVAGETFGLLGPNGAGKTTTISMIAGLLQPDDGEVQVVGQRVTPRTPKSKAAIGLVPQDLSIYPDLTARENLRFFGRLYGLTGDRLASRTDEVLEVTGLSERADDRADQFSGGMKRRLNIGIGLLHEPTLLILDEPTVGVDPQSRNAILESVEQLATAGMAVLYTTHYMEEAERLCDRLAIIDRGLIVAEGTVRELTGRIGELDRVRLEVTGDLAAAAAACAALDAVSSADVEDRAVVCVVNGAAKMLPEMLSAVAGAGGSVTGVEVHQPDLEAVFLHLTGRALRD
jgi:ABC-2 type transport system ATP-binding protein